jgi:hypothetical protein
MANTAAQRSIARRDALTKAAQALPFNPAQALGYAGMLGGGALVGDAGMNGEQSTLKRIGKGVLSAGLAYAGHKALTDQKWQDTIGSGTQKAISYIRGILNKAAEAAYVEGFCKAAASGGATLQKQAQKLKLLAGAARAAGIRKALAAGIILPPAPSLKELIRVRVAGIRGTRGLGWPLPAYPGRAGRAKGLRDYEDRLWWTGYWRKKMRDGKTPRLYEAKLLRQLNGDRGAEGAQLVDALQDSHRKYKQFGIDLSPFVTKKKAEEAAYAEGFCKAAEVAGVDPAALYKQAFAAGDLVSLGLKAWRGLRGAGAAAARATRNPRQTLGAARGMGSRYLELLRGGNAQAMSPVNTIGNNAAEAAEMFGGGRLSQGFARIGSRYGMAAGSYDTMARQGLRLGSTTRADYANYLRGKGELRKVIGARAATGGLLGGSALAMRGGNETASE